MPLTSMAILYTIWTLNQHFGYHWPYLTIRSVSWSVDLDVLNTDPNQRIFYFFSSWLTPNKLYSVM